MNISSKLTSEDNMKTKILIILTLILFLTLCFVSAKNINEIGFNVSSELKPVKGAVGLHFNNSDVYFSISEQNSKKMSEGFGKYNNTVYISNNTINGTVKTIIFAYGEYIKIGGKTYWVEVSNANLQNPNYEKCLEVLRYFNEHNTFEPVPVS